MKTDILIQADSIKIIKTFPDNSIHAIISDIPYGIGYEEWDVLHDNKNSAYGGSSPAQVTGGGLFRRRGKPLNGWSEADKHIPKEYQEWCSSWAGEWLRILKPGGTCFIFAGRRYAHRCIIALEDAGFTFRDMLAWEKDSAPHRAQRLSVIYERRNDFANAEKWQSWRVANLRPLFEPVLWFQKPYIVLDPFMGSGTTCIAAKHLKRHYIGIDIEEENIRIANERLNASDQCEISFQEK